MSPDKNGMVPVRRPPQEAASTWGPYYDALHPERTTHMMIAWKVVPKWMESAEKLWQQRQELRRAYEVTHGGDPAKWPNQHPGVVLHGIPACLRCHWLGESGYYRHDHVFQYPADIARRHEATNGEFGGGEDRLMPTARATPSPPPVKTPPIPRRIPPLPLRIADRYATGRRRSWK